MMYRKYSEKSEVGHWHGWLENSNGTVIAFIKKNGEVIFNW
jgi:hypothetical protein